MRYILAVIARFLSEIIAFISGALAIGSFYGGSYTMGVIFLCIFIPSFLFSTGGGDNTKTKWDVIRFSLLESVIIGGFITLLIVAIWLSV